MSDSTDQRAHEVVLKDGRALCFAEYGDTDGRPVIYCHGSQSSRLEMHYDKSFITAHGLRVIAVDRPGHGRSDFNPAGTIESFADDLAQMADRLGIDSFAVAGMSAGSAFALGAARFLPQRVTRVVIVSGFAPYTPAAKEHLTSSVRFLLEFARRTPFLLRPLLRLQRKQLQKNPRKVVRQFLQAMSEPDQAVLANPNVMEVIIAMFSEAFRAGHEGVAHEITKVLVKDWGFALSDVTQPVFIFQGEDDANVPTDWAHALASEIPNASLKTFPREGHLIIFGHADEIFARLAH